MSRTLRRPMFRGGRVSSYGTGIASGLAEGGRVGYYTDQRGGIVDPMRFSFPNKQITGGDLMSMNRNQALKMAELYGPSSIVDPLSLTYGNINSLPATDAEITTTEKVVENPNVEIEDEHYSLVDKEADKDFSLDLNLIETPEERDERITTARIHKLSDKPWEVSAKNLKQKKKTIGDSELEKIRAELEQLRKDGAGSESLDIDKKTYLKLLRGDKARGKDITAMLLGFAGSKGDTTMEKFQNFAATEATRPGKREGLEEGAAMLAIKDYIAGKRSKEQLDVLLSQLDYKGKLSKKNLAEHISEARKTRSGVGALKDGIQAWRPGVKIEEILSTEALEFGSEDEGVIFIETDTKDVYTIKDGAKIPLYTS